MMASTSSSGHNMSVVYDYGELLSDLQFRGTIQLGGDSHERSCHATLGAHGSIAFSAATAFIALVGLCSDVGGVSQS